MDHGHDNAKLVGYAYVQKDRFAHEIQVQWTRK